MRTFFIFLAFTSLLFAKPITQIQAQNVALNWMQTKSGIKYSVISQSQKRSRALNQDYYIIKLKPKGWVIVTGDDDFKPIIGYGTSNMSKELPDALKGWLKEVSSQMHRAKKDKNFVKNSKLKQKWNRLKQSPFSYRSISQKSVNSPDYIVKPLLWLGGNNEESGINLFQENPLNKYCPSIGENNTSLVGCVATALAQIMTYHKYPYRAIGSNSYNDAIYGKISKDFSESFYDWNNMALNRSSNYLALDNSAKLSYDIGVATNMQYSPQGSSAFDANANRALNQNFFYKSRMYYKEYITNNKWHELIKNELKNSRPVYYAGSNEKLKVGHAFVVDGYDKDNFYHINLGWGGYFNGKYVLGNIALDNINFSSMQSMISLIPYNKYKISFKDKELEQCVQDYDMQFISPRPINPTPIILEDMQKITSLDCSNRGITDINDLKDFKNLTSLDITGNYIDDFSIQNTLPSLSIIGQNEQKFYPDIYEDNNNFNSAKKISKGTFSLSLTANDVDFFTFDMPYRSNVEFEISDTNENALLKLYNENMNYIELTFSKISRQLSKGKYFLKIETYQKEIKHYTLRVDIPNNVNLSPIYYLLLN